MAESSQRLFKGAQVRNVQGGPTMIIDALSEHLAICHWYAEGRLHEGLFSPKTLRLHQEGQQTCLWPELSTA